ncbi:MAG: hypothetical protein KDE27_18370 [Planctomycetes bacterium]|nr:hypothetical protein [Planctomycetota bacterium]
MRTRSLLHVAVAATLTPVALAQDWVGSWSVSPMSYTCPNVNYTVDRLEIAPSGANQASIRLLPSFPVVPLLASVSGNTLTAHYSEPGLCAIDYSLSITFPDPYSCIGTLDVDFHGWWCACSHQIQMVAGNRVVTATYLVIGPACSGSLGETRLVPQNWPLLGTTFRMDADNLPQGFALLVHGYSDSVWALGTLPAPLDGFGMPGCTARVSVDAIEFLAGTGTTATWTLAVPNAPELLGLRWHQQAFVPDPGFNAAGAVASQARTLVIGNQ